MKDRITETFDTLKRQGRKALVGYLTAGNPDIRGSERDIRTALDNGVDILELGIPFSDPTADGPVIQAAALRALEGGMNMARALELTRRIRKDYPRNPIVLFGYANPFASYGYQRLCRDAARAGADGLLVVDIPFEESGELEPHAARHGLALIRLVAPTTDARRARKILSDARGFVYCISSTGVTGARRNVRSGIAAQVRSLRRATKLPIVVGFGISSGPQAGLAARAADGVVVGSALVKAAGEGRLKRLAAELRRALDA